MSARQLLCVFLACLAGLPGRLPAEARKGSGKPLALHPTNPHYFLFRGKPAVLITSGEHYGAVLNREFDYVKYLDELQKHGLELTRTFTGAYAEDSKSFGIARNTLAPTSGKLICPWARRRNISPLSADRGWIQFPQRRLAEIARRRLEAGFHRLPPRR